jgi:hypothetical protein
MLRWVVVANADSLPLWLKSGEHLTTFFCQSNYVYLLAHLQYPLTTMAGASPCAFVASIFRGDETGLRGEKVHLYFG